MRSATIAGVVAGALLTLAAVGAPVLASPPPTDTDIICFGDMKPCGEPVTLGEPKWKPGRVVISGYSSGIGPCFDYSHGDSASGTCGDTGPGKDAIQINGLNWSVRGNRTVEYTELAGVLSTDVARVSVRYRRKGEASRLDAFSYQMTAEVRKQLKAPKPFGIFEVSVAGCVPGSHFRATAFDAGGARLGTTRVPQLKGNCRNPQPGTGGFIFFDREAHPLPADGLGRLTR